MEGPNLAAKNDHHVIMLSDAVGVALPCPALPCLQPPPQPPTPRRRSVWGHAGCGRAGPGRCQSETRPSLEARCLQWDGWGTASWTPHEASLWHWAPAVWGLLPRGRVQGGGHQTTCILRGTGTAALSLRSWSGSPAVPRPPAHLAEGVSVPRSQRRGLDPTSC